MQGVEHNWFLICSIDKSWAVVFNSLLILGQVTLVELIKSSETTRVLDVAT